MMPHLDGTREIVPFQECPSILLYKNVNMRNTPSTGTHPRKLSYPKRTATRSSVMEKRMN